MNIVEVKHSEKNNAWNVVGTAWGGKYKWARVPYTVVELDTFSPSPEELNLRSKFNARESDFAEKLANDIASMINGNQSRYT